VQRHRSPLVADPCSWLVWIVVSIGVASCSNGPKHEDATAIARPAATATTPAAAEPMVYLTGPQGELAITVEVVDTEPKIMKGLMYREHLPLDRGMLFLMGFESDHAFYMRNTLIPLDIIFITKDLTIAGIAENATPRTETLRRVGAPSLYVLEVNGGWSAAHQVRAGTKVRFAGVRL
jgi:uncharacterized protein